LAAVPDMMAMANAMMAFQRQAAEMIPATKADLAQRGLGFSQEDLDAIAVSAAAHPFPEGYDPNAGASAETLAEAEDVSRRAMEADYPENGFALDDPRIAPVEGVPLPLLAILAKAIGWSTEEAFVEQIVTAVGLDVETWKRASEVWRERVTHDVVVAAFYGQLFTAA
jgi:hypothetical protein